LTTPIPVTIASPVCAGGYFDATYECTIGLAPVTPLLIGLYHEAALAGAATAAILIGLYQLLVTTALGISYAKF